MENIFEKILDDNEEIIKIYKPSKFKFYFSAYSIFVFAWLMMFLFATLIYLFPGELEEQPPSWIFLVLGGVALVSLMLTILFLSLSYKKRVYAYTNKRILIASGIIGLDFKSLDHEMIGAIEVRVDFLDKLLKKDTGTLKFGSMASPLQDQRSMFVFGGVVDPYGSYQEIKKYIDSVK